MELINGDCLIKLKDIKDNSVDLVVIDPPYSFDDNGGGGAFGSKKREYHKSLEYISNGIENEILDELVRVMKKINIYIWCNKNQILQFLTYFSNLGANFDLLTWHKTNPVPTCSNKYLSDTEYLLFFREKGVKVYGEYRTKHKYYVSSTNKKDKAFYKHPTIKPLNITMNIIENSSLKGDVVLDCFMGSGTTGVACKKLNRKFIGMEIEKDIFDIAKRRIENTSFQLELF